MYLPRKLRSLSLLLLLALGVVQLSCGAEVEVTGITATATKYDTRANSAEDEYKGCFTDGCSAELTLDGLLNDETESRWSCSESLNGTMPDCSITFDLGSSYSLTRMEIYFHKSDELDRDVNPFTVFVSDDGIVYTYSFDGVNTAGTALGVAEGFDFPLGTSGQYVRLTAILAEDQWMSMCEAIFYAESAASPAPTASNRDIESGTTPSPAGVIVDAPSPGSTPIPTAAPDPCSTVTVTNAGDYNGDYTSNTTTVSTFDGSETYASATISATITSSVAPASCPTSGSETDCSMDVWQITSQGSDSTLPIYSYLVYDSATHPSAISEVWFKLENCPGCTYTPAEVDILCGDGSTLRVGTPAPAVVTASDCDIIEVSGTSGAESDGLYHSNASATGEVAHFTGYDVDDGEMTSNGLTISARSVDSSCSSTSTSTTDCSLRQWWIESSTSGDVDYFTYDEADHPADIASDTLWYMSNSTIQPYMGGVAVSCSSVTIPPVEPTPAPTATPRDGDDNTRSPVNPSPVSPAPVDGNSTAEPAVTGTDGGDSDDDAGKTLAVIVGGAAGGAVLLGLIAILAYKLKKPPPPPPSYNDLVGGA